VCNNVIVGVDGRDGGRDAIALSRTLLAQGGQLTLAHIHSGDAHTRTSAPTEHHLVKQEGIAKMLEAASKDAGLEQLGMRQQEASSVGRGLHELCEVIEADLLVVGSRVTTAVLGTEGVQLPAAHAWSRDE